MREFGEIFEAIKSGKVIREDNFKNITHITEPADELHLSLQGQKRIGPKQVKGKTEIRPEAFKSDQQGNIIRFSHQASSLAQSGSDAVAWETRTKAETVMPEVIPDKEKIEILIHLGLLRGNDK